MKTAIKSFLNDRRGAIAVLTGFFLLIVLATAGLGIDYSFGVNQYSRLQNSADFAAVSVAKSLAEDHNWHDAQEVGHAAFTQNAQNIDRASVKFSREVKDGTITVVATAEAQWDRYISQLLTSNKSLIKARSVATQMKRPIDIMFVADVSYSMGIGATDADVALMQSRLGCAFACHMDGTDTAAHDIGAKLRIDVIRDAVSETIDEIKSIKRNGDLIRVGLVTFSNSIVTSIEPTTDHNVIKHATDKIVMPEHDYQGGTDFHATLAKVALDIEARKKIYKDGTQTYVILLTDAVEHTRMMVPGPSRAHLFDTDVPITSPFIYVDPESYIMAISPVACDAVKNTGASMMILAVNYVTKNIPGTAGVIETQLKPIMPERNAACASDPSYVKNAHDPDEIRRSIGALTATAVRGPMRIAH